MNYFTQSLGFWIVIGEWLTIRVRLVEKRRRWRVEKRKLGFWIKSEKGIWMKIKNCRSWWFDLASDLQCLSVFFSISTTTDEVTCCSLALCFIIYLIIIINLVFDLHLIFFGTNLHLNLNISNSAVFFV